MPRALSLGSVTGWLSGIDPTDVVRIEIVRVTLEGTPSCVTRAEFDVHLREGGIVVTTVCFEFGFLYESLVAVVRDTNRLLRD